MAAASNASPAPVPAKIPAIAPPGNPEPSSVSSCAADAVASASVPVGDIDAVVSEAELRAEETNADEAVCEAELMPLGTLEDTIPPMT